MKPRYFSTFQLILLALFSALVVVAKISLRAPLQLPGHSGIFWMAIVIVATKVVPKPGAASIVGISSGLIASFLGMGDFGALNTFLSYSFIGIASDLILYLLGGDSGVLFVDLMVGILGHLGKFLMKWFFGVISGAPLGFMALGLLRSLLGYIIFGAIGGLLGWLTLKGLERAGFFAYLAEKK
jgi:ABC-type thiamin/hydroxymethylpyrimidine transport system permease subunit